MLIFRPPQPVRGPFSTLPPMSLTPCKLHHLCRIAFDCVLCMSACALSRVSRLFRQYTLTDIEHDKDSERSRWLRDIFEQADANGDKELSLVCFKDTHTHTHIHTHTHTHTYTHTHAHTRLMCSDQLCTVCVFATCNCRKR